MGSMICTSRSGDRVKMREIFWWPFMFYADLLYDRGLPHEYEDTLKTIEGVAHTLPSLRIGEL